MRSQRTSGLCSRTGKLVAAFSTVRIDELTPKQFTAKTGAPDRLELAEDVRQDGYQIMVGKGYAPFGIATATVRICDAVLREEKSVLPISTLAFGRCGITGTYLSLPCVLGARGVERILTPDLMPDEEALRAASAKALTSVARRRGLRALGPAADHQVSSRGAKVLPPPT